MSSCSWTGGHIKSVMAKKFDNFTVNLTGAKQVTGAWASTYQKVMLGIRRMNMEKI